MPLDSVETSLRNHFLIAMPALREGFFAGSITYLCDHNSDGAFGIVINQPLDVPLSEILEHLEINSAVDLHDKPVMAGGPVEVEHGFVLHDGARNFESTMRVNPNLAVSTSKDVLMAIGQGDGPEHYLVALGYSGWGPGQLESELADNAWLTVAADTEIIFDLPFEQRVDLAAQKLGIDMRLMTSDIGHA